MCTYQTTVVELSGSGTVAGEWIALRRAVVSFDHPQDAPLDHALAVDFRGADDDPTAHMMVELDATSARRLAAAIIATLESTEADALL